MTTHTVGRAVPRKEGPGKVTGAAQYVDDLTFDDMLFGVTVRSPVPRGRIIAVHYEGDLPWDEITVVTAADIPGENRQALIETDQPCLASERVNHREEPVVLLAHADRGLLERARRHVRIEIEPEPSVHDLDAALAADPVIWGTDNVLKSYRIEKGDVDAAFAREDVVIVCGDYRTGAQEQLYIEPQGMIARATPEDGVTVWGSLQCPYYVQQALEVLFGLPRDKVRVIHCVTGGGFGGKEEYPSVLAGHAGLLALKTGKPVKMVYDRAEDMVATTKRHPSRTRHRTAVTRDGALVAMDIDFVLDGGAYATLTAVVLSRGTIHAAGPYHCENVRVRARAVATNTPPHGAFRGFGAPQSTFAYERQLDKVAAAVGLAPDELRRRNVLRKGLTTATGQTIAEDVDLCGLIDRALADADYAARKAEFAQTNPTSTVKRGIGFATFFHGAGFTGSGEEHLASRVGAQAGADGRVTVLAASTEMGQGANTVFSQIAADAIGLDYEKVDVARPDTGAVPDSGPTVASRTTMIVGGLVAEAVCQLRGQLVEKGLLEGTEGDVEGAAWDAACARHHAEHGPLCAEVTYHPPPGIKWDDAHYKGDAYGTYAWAVYVATVAVDTVTAVPEVTDFVARQEIGRVIHPVLAAGQIEGGVGQGIGMAIYEKCVWDQGRMANGQLTNYIIPTAADLPEIRVFFEERPYAFGAAGAKGIGELPLDGVAPAVANAIADALGTPIDHVPVMPEDLMTALDGAQR